MSNDHWFSDSSGYMLNRRALISSIVYISLLVSIIFISLRCLRWHRNSHRATLQRVTPARPDSEQLKAGLDPPIIEKLPVFVYKPSESPDESRIDCAVCLGAIEENEMGRLLPNCKHMFHVQCIDMWLHSHATCPICRTGVEPQVRNESGDLTAVNSSALPVELSTVWEDASNVTGQSPKVGLLGLRISFHRSTGFNSERSKSRMEACGPSEGVGDIERQ